jgi:hypothetical protein
VPGLVPVWPHELVSLTYKSQENRIKIELYDVDKPTILVCSGETSVSQLKQAGNAIISIPLDSSEHQVGCLKLETFNDTSLKEHEDPESLIRPHVLFNCVVCRDTHRNAHGIEWQCKYCVCYKCEGTGIKIKNGSDCLRIKTAETESEKKK